MVELLFSTDAFSPSQVGEFCDQSLVNKRMSQGKTDDFFPDILN